MIKNNLEKSNNYEEKVDYDINNNAEKIEEEIKENNNIDSGDNNNKLTGVEVKLEGGEATAEEKANNNNPANPYDLPDDF